MSASDDELLAGWRAGDKRAGNALLCRHFDALFRFFRTKVDAGHEDLVQATFLACVRSREQFRGDSSFKSYLFGIARKELLRMFRNRRRDRLVFDPDQGSVHDLSPGPSTLAMAKAEQRLLLEALRRIPLDLQIALELHYWESMSTRELAGILEIPQGTVKSRLRRGREALELALAKLSDDAEQLRSTIGNLESWARQVRDAAGSGGES